MSTATFKIWRGDAKGGAFRDYETEITDGMVVLDAIHQIQAESANAHEFVTGTVIDQEGLPLSEVRVHVSRFSQGRGPISNAEPVLTDSDGRLAAAMGVPNPWLEPFDELF